MKRISILAACVTLAGRASAEKIALTGGTLIKPGNGQIVENAIILIDGNRIARVGEAKSFNWPEAWGPRIDCTGKFILPGYIDTHVHFFQSGDLFTRPDGADLNSVRPTKTKLPGSSRIWTTRLRVIS